MLEPFDSLQGVLTKANIPNKNILIINGGPKVELGLGDPGNGVQIFGVGLPNCVVVCGPSTASEAFETEAKVPLSTNRLLMSGA
jgi:hypothetical protein